MELMQVVCTVAIGKTFARPVVKIWNFLPAHIADFSILTCFERLLPIFFSFIAYSKIVFSVSLFYVCSLFCLM